MAVRCAAICSDPFTISKTVPQFARWIKNRAPVTRAFSILSVHSICFDAASPPVKKDGDS